MRLFAALAPPGDFFGGIVEEEGGENEKSHLHWPWAVVMCHVVVFARRAALEVTAVFCGQPLLVVIGGGLSWFFNLAVKAP